MFKIPNSLLDENESYLVIPILKKFCAANNLKIFNIRDDLIKEIYKFANSNDNNKDITLNWLDDCLKEGIKHIYLKQIFASREQMAILKSSKKCIDFLEQVYPDCPQNYISSCTNIPELKLQSYHIVYDEDQQVTKICFYFTILLLEGNELYQRGKRFIYPIFIDVDLVNGYIIGRSKSKSKMFYKKNPKSDILYDDSKASAQTLILKAISQIKYNLKLNYVEISDTTSHLKNKLYHLLKEYTFTPEEIKVKINSVNGKINSFIEDLFEDIDVPLINNFQNAKEDLSIFAEKYISINYEDQNIFTRDREAYPIKLSSTDSEFTKVEETSADKEPLQHKEKFFDNKKSIEREQTCDGMTLCFNRIDSKYFGNDPYTVRLDVKKGFCLIKFFQYVEEEDIQNVLSRIIYDSE